MFLYEPLFLYEPPASRKGLARRMQDHASWVGPGTELLEVSAKVQRTTRASPR